jgi:predicted PurR-regulated permease PerM
MATRVVARTVLIVILSVVAIYILYLLRKPIGWIVVALFIAVAMSGPVNFLSRRMRRGLAIALSYLALLLAPVLLGALIVPPFVSQLQELVDQAPEYARDVQAFVAENERLNALERDYQIVDKLQERAEELPARIGDAAGVLGGLGLGIVNSVFALVTILIMSVFLVSSGPRWVQGLLRLQPADRSARMSHVLYRMGDAVGNYVAGALLQAIVAGILTFLVLTLLGMPFAAPLAVLVALLDLIPLVGATIGAVLVGIVTLFNDFPTTTIIWVVWSIIYQQLENTIIQPQIQKRAVQVHPFVVLVAVLFGSTLFGVLGALMAIPVAASIQISIREWWSWRKEREDASDRSAATTTPAAPAGADGVPPGAVPASS